MRTIRYQLGRVVKDPNPYVLAEERLAPAAVEAVAAKLRVVGSNAVSDFEAFDVL